MMVDRLLVAASLAGLGLTGAFAKYAKVVNAVGLKMD